MKLATYKNNTRDGKLMLVSRDLTKAIEVADIAGTSAAPRNWGCKMMAAHDERLNAVEVKMAIKFVLQRAATQADAERGAIAAALSIIIATRGAAGAVDQLRDLADVIEHDLMVPPGEVMQ